MSYPRSRSGRRGRITSHENAAGTQKHQGSHPRSVPPTMVLSSEGFEAGAGYLLERGYRWRVFSSSARRASANGRSSQARWSASP